ncbi:beta-galactosidase [Streptomyces violascens]|uniref:beta-galactosidase n=1 Tax=Streptomyces violascens TaxID=67381 RepID=A0ABQ3QYE6_9ACTN|nr:beta-galactosidase [Streptomyces violascens]GGU22761.1 beta-galactosidase [Streptomyces violascens]GHI42283.1 beta-galactosidase [Streptomyces violascens]
MRTPLRAAALAVTTVLALGAAGLTATAPAAQARPTAPAAAHTVGHDDHALTIDGKPLSIWSGEFHYWRLPSPDAWRDVLQKMKAGGFNAASIYFDWDFHSPKPGVYDFTGVRDVDKLLDIAREVGIYVIARPGPYINAETDGGGFPGWLVTQKGKARTTAPDYLAAADEWLSRIDPVLARHQLTNGTGTVIAYQVENEYYQDTPDGHAYIRHLVDKAHADGITVPLTGNHNGVFAKELDIDGHDSYPQGFNCSSPDTWHGLPDLSGAKSSDEPLFLAEFQGGSFDPWGGPGFDKCRRLTDGDFEKAAYENNIASGATMQNFYMAYGGTSWGWLPSPGAVYSSYDYGAPIREDRQLSEKYLVDKRLGYLVQSVAPLTKTQSATASAPDNASVLRRDRRNPDDGTTITVVRHKDVNNKAKDTTHLALGGYASVPQEPGTALTVDGRDSKLLVSDYAMDHQRLTYSTSELMTHGTFGARDVALLYGRHGQDGESVLRYAARPGVKVLSGQVGQTWDAATGDLRLNYRHDGLAQVLITPSNGSTPLLLLLADDATADTYWRLDTPQGPVLASGPELLRTASYDRGVLKLTGDTDKAASLHVLTGAPATSVSWNGRPAPGALDTTGSALAGPKPASLPALGSWKVQRETPEAEPGFDDAAWRAADKPVLSADDYGFHAGSIWYRGHFAAAGTESGIQVDATTGKGGAYLAWLNGTYLGSSADATHLFAVPGGVLKAGKDNVLAVLAADMAHEQDWSADDSHKQPRGLTSVRLVGSAKQIGWRLQGALGGEDLVDPVRGGLNTGGLYGERQGMHLPGYPDGGWPSTSLPDTRSGAAGVSWYRAAFDLDLPQGQDVPLGLTISDDKAKHYRALVYVNGWMTGLYVNALGPQKSFPVQPGMLRTHGHNTVAIAVIGEDAGGDGLGKVTLDAYGNHTTPLRYGDIASPGWSAATNRDPRAGADVRISAPDTIGRGAAGEVTASFTPRRTAARDASLTVRLPDGWTASAPLTQALGDVPAGRTVTRAWKVTAASGSGPWSAVLSAAARYRGGTASAAAGVASPPPSPGAGAHDVADLDFTATNGWGPVERNTSNGEDAAGDGRPMSIAGVPYAKGLGVHAAGDVRVFLGGACSRFTASVGVDDETGGGGSVAFSVLADGRAVAATGVLRGRGAAVPLAADVSGAQVVDLVVTDGGDGNGLDHGDWAGATLTCG